MIHSNIIIQNSDILAECNAINDNIMIHSIIIIQNLDILAECNAINDGQLYTLRSHKLYFRKKNAFFN